jgi:hypothetical protein
MFQYAAGIALGQNTSQRVLVDVSAFKKYKVLSDK